MTKNKKSDKQSSMHTDNHKKQISIAYDEYQRLLHRLEKLEQVQKSKNKQTDFDFHTLHGLALKAPKNPNPRFKTEDDLWKDDV
ncbi:MAG: hypothetical protein H7A33_03065 [Deltaproteobacteria bacterium]|nr:hypothetical protein [Deltaproteobacteria bacterium]